MKANYEEDKIIVSSTEPTGIDRKKVWIKKGKNLIDKKNMIPGYIKSDGSFTTGNLNEATSNYVEIESAIDYTLSANDWTGEEEMWLAISLYDENKTFINRFSAYDVSVTVPATETQNAKYIRTSNRYNDDNIKIMLEQGSTATDYEPYIEKEIYVKNENGVWEKYVLEDINEINNKFSNFYNEDNGRVMSRAIEISKPGNIDNMLNSGIFSVMSTGGGTFPSGLGGNSCMVLVQTDNIQYNAQLAFGFGSDKIAIRRRNGSTTWTAWKYIALS